jgi:hypothetical protein
VAPEQTVGGGAVDRKVDLYAVGVVLHELLTLERPACSPATVEELGAPRKPYEPRADLPGPLNYALGRALAVDPQERWPTAAAFCEDLEAWVAASGHTRQEGDVAGFLKELLGEALGSPGRGGATDIVPVYTAPLAPSTLPVMRAVVPPPAPRAAAAAPRERTQSAVALTIAGVTAVLFSVPIVISVLAGPRIPERDSGEAGMSVAPPEAKAPGEQDTEVVSKGPVRRPPRPPPVRRPVRMGHLDVRVNPFAEVSVNGRVLGTTPFEPVELPPGPVTLVLKNQKLGVVRKVPVVVVAGQTVTVKVNLLKKK